MKLLRSLLRIAGLVVLIAGGVPAGFFAWISWMPASSHEGELAPLSDRERIVAERLRRHVRRIAGDIGERNLARRGAYVRAEAYLTAELEGAGYAVRTDDVPAGEAVFHNLVVEIPGEGARDEIIVVGAHYDSPLGSPGADDNASGTAGLLEIARLLEGARPERSVRLVLFANEEPPFFRTEQMGSRIHARAAAARGDDIRVMFSIEMIGFYSSEPGSQHFPPPLHYFYPDRGDFVGFVGNLPSRSAVTDTIARFRALSPFPSQGIAAPAWVRGTDYSDHWSFSREGYPALMVTDTASLRNPNYHRGTDTPDTLDYDRMARVVVGLREVIGRWAREN